MNFGIAGAGFTGAVIARQLAEAGHTSVVFDTRDHVGGNCFTKRDESSGILIHQYGAHIFHTADERVWEYVTRFGEMVPFNHRVRTTSEGSVHLLPINLLTINQLFGTTMGPDEARAFLAKQADQSIDEPANFEEQALKFVGRRIYDAFFYGYTKKQWGIEPRELPASVLKRLPVRFTYEDSYFDHPHQALPRDGYTAIVEAILDHPSISVRLSEGLDPANRSAFSHIVWTGPLDAWFGYKLGKLGYRTLDFESFRYEGDYQGCSVMNYADTDIPYTRIVEHKHFSPWESHSSSVLYREYSRAAEPGDTPYYPIRLANDKALLDEYLKEAQAQSDVTFAGRLGTYRYLDMDVTIGEALLAADGINHCIASGSQIPPFLVDPS